MKKRSSHNDFNRKAMARHKKRFLSFFPDAFQDELYIDWERTYKWEAHKLFDELLNKSEFARLLRKREYPEIATRALRIESRTNFLFSFEKMALRDAVRTSGGASSFSEGLYNLLYEKGSEKEKFIAWIMTVSQLPRKKSRVCSWPVLTFFPFIAQPKKHIIMKPTAMRRAAQELDFDLEYSSKPTYTAYENLLNLADITRESIADLNPQDYHDLQTFLWVIGSGEYDRIEEEMFGSN